jgi:hypothetical protein
MSTSTINQVVDYLVAMASDLALTESPDGQAPLIADGYPGTNEPLDIIAVGGMIEPTSTGQDSWENLGVARAAVGKIKEEYSVACYCQSTRGGTDQKTARDAAFALYNAFIGGIRNDPTMGQLLIFCTPTRVEVQQTSASDASEGRTCLVSFSIDCRARI